MLASSSGYLKPVLDSLRAQKNDLNNVECQNFDLKLILAHITREKKQGSKRVSSSGLETESFYETGSTDGSRSVCDIDDTQNGNAILTLKAQLTEAREHRDELQSRLKHLSQKHDDLAIKHQQTLHDYESDSGQFREIQAVAEKKQQQHLEKDSNLREELRLALMEVSDTKSMADNTNLVISELTKRSADFEEQMGRLQIKSKYEKEALEGALNNLKTEIGTKDKEVIEASLRARESTRVLLEERRRRENGEASLQEKSKELREALKKAKSYLLEREAIKQAFQSELKKGANLKKATALIEQGKFFHNKESKAYDNLAKIIKGSESQFMRKAEYNPNWREEVTKHFNACMEMLSMLHLEVQAKQLYFLECDSPVKEHRREVGEQLLVDVL